MTAQMHITCAALSIPEGIDLGSRGPETSIYPCNIGCMFWQPILLIAYSGIMPEKVCGLTAPIYQITSFSPILLTALFHYLVTSGAGHARQHAFHSISRGF